MTFDANEWARNWSPGTSAVKGEGVAAQFTEDCERWDVGIDSRARGREEVSQFAQSFLDAVPDAVCTFTWSTRDGDTVVVEWSWTGTHTGDMTGWPATGRRFTLLGCNVIELSGELIRRERSYWDQKTLFAA